MSTLSYSKYDDIGAFEGLYQQASDSAEYGWRNFIEGFEILKADFSQVNNKSRMPRLTRLLLKTSR